ncbi:MAG: hypothetical protein KTR13_06915 [Saprospiraceae bacterium]|nr:hypothetical protein [Saprospiraceae bacterium]
MNTFLPNTDNEFTFETYKPRAIQPVEAMRVNGWTVKIYTITNKSTYSSWQVLAAAERLLLEWTTQADNNKHQVHKHAFLILHEAREGVWLLFNWWTGGEMIDTKVYFAHYDHPETIQASPYNSHALVCVWELQVFTHERQAWIKHILQKAKQPDFNSYSQDVITYAS